MSLHWTKRTKSVVAASLAAVVVAGVGTGLWFARGQTPPPGTAGPQPSASVTTPLVSPFTGEPVQSLQRVLAVKIDNIVSARPQTGLGSADIVYVLPVEGGLTRFMAIFSSHLPPVIGPVRSAREDDVELLRQFGRPAFAYSGAHPKLLPGIEHARTVDLYSGRVSGYYRDSQRAAPDNLYAHTSKLMAQAGDASVAHSIGFQFGTAPTGGVPTTSTSVRYAAASYTFTWSAQRGRWLVTMDGRPAMTTDSGQLSAATVVIQHTVIRKASVLEWGQPSPYAQSTGHGSAVVLRDGSSYQAQWSRPAADGGTTFTTDTGQPMTFATGPVWILLVP